MALYPDRHKAENDNSSDIYALDSFTPPRIFFRLLALCLIEPPLGLKFDVEMLLNPVHERLLWIVPTVFAALSGDHKSSAKRIRRVGHVTEYLHKVLKASFI